MTTILYPMRLDASLHVKVWGGRRLAEKLDKQLPTDEPYGEAWELHDSSVIVNGIHAGRRVAEIIRQMRYDIVGRGNRPEDGMPLLAKLLDANDWLSVQVHPNDAQAQLLEKQPRGKTEAWIILAADEGARLVIGVDPHTTREMMASAIQQGKLEDLLVYADVKAGDVLYIPANTIHAIGPGILLYEIQQSSNVTYRLYDWGRMGLDGKARELHTEKGVQVSNLGRLPMVTHPEGNVMVAGDYFITARHRLQGERMTLATAGRFQALTCIEGEAVARGNKTETPFVAGQTVLIPAGMEVFTLSGQGTVLRSWQRG